MWNIVLGPPGTGKTTFLLKKVEKFLEEGTDPQSIAYLAFTKKAATEALDRAVEKFMFDAEEPAKKARFKTIVIIDISIVAGLLLFWVPTLMRMLK